jgi:hypothetical protein
VCASCNPTGARPVGIEGIHYQGKEVRPLVDYQGTWEERWFAAAVPGWTGLETGMTRQQPRYLSDSGQLFFDSVDPLVPQATNGLSDVYEYEPVGIGGCSSSNVTFSSVSGGCAALISSGASGEETVFMDASENGNDVFFLTAAPLVPQDLDTSFDVYDAHLCSISSPCAPVVASPPACTTADSCRVAPSPQPAIFGAPASSTFSGSGNVVPAVARKPAVKKVKKPKKHKPKRKRGRKSRAKGGRVSVRGRNSTRSGKSSSSSRTGR